MTLSYAFGGNTGQSYDALQRRRAYLEAVQKAGQGAQPKTGAEGVLSGLNSVFSDLMLRKLGKQEDANREKATQAALDIFGRPAPDVIPPNPGVSTPRNPNDPVQIGNDTMAALGKTPNGWDGIKAGIFAGESGGDYNALFGFQNRPGGAFSNVQLTGMSVDDALKFADPNGQYGQHVKGQIGRVATPMGAYQVVGTTLAAAKKGLGLRGDEIMTPALQDRIGQWIYQNQGTGAWEGYKGPQQPQGGMDPQILMAMSDPYVSPEIKSALGVLLQQRIAAAQPPDPMDALELEKAKLEVDRLKNPGPPESVTTRLMLAKQAGLQPGTPEYSTYMATGELPKPQEPVKPIEINNKLVDPTTGKVIGDYGTPDPGFRMLTPEEAAAMGLPPGAYQVGPDNKISEIGGGGTSVTVNNNGDAVPNDAALMKALGEGEGKAWSGYLDSGTTSSGMVQDLDLLDQIITMAPQGPVQGRLASMFPGVNSAADAFTSIVKRVAPTLKTAGSGSTSDIEYDGMLKSLPQLSSRPEANVAISKMMRAKAEINMARASIVRDVQNGQLSVTDGRRKMSELDKQSIMTPELKEILANLAPAKTPPAPASNAKQPAKISSDAEYDALKSGDVFIGPDGQTRRKP